MDSFIFPTTEAMARAAAAMGARRLREALAARPEVAIIVATGASQLEMLACLVKEPDIAWDRVSVFHLDEYVGLPITHGASFRGYLWREFHSRLPLPVRAFHYLDPEVGLEGVSAALRAFPGGVSVAFIGIGENGHIAFNDPPADFEIDTPYHTVTLDAACRRQQLGEGWFPTLEAVPTQAVSMTVRQILRSQHLILTVPDARKAPAVRASVQGPISPLVPASILQQHRSCWLFLDEPAAGHLSR
jgi:glucosamine-6-phosphate deaminase